MANKQDWRPRRELSDEAARKLLAKRLRALDWRPAAVDAIVSSLDSMDGPWSYGTVRAVKDLASIFEELVEERGEPPDRNW